MEGYSLREVTASELLAMRELLQMESVGLAKIQAMESMIDDSQQNYRWGVAKSVRHGTLTPACVGSSPAAPAIFSKQIRYFKLDIFSGPLAQSVEHLTFNQGVGGSSPPWLTIIFPGTARIARFLFCRI
jgi:hypothetical protein